MVILSAILYFLTYHPFWSWPVLVLVGWLLARVLAKWRKNNGWYALLLVFFIYAHVNVFTAHIFNALFLEAFGVDGTAVITHMEETSSTLNDQNVWDYDAVMKTADGRDVVAQFDTMSASIYPITNAILIPPQGETFAVRYIPGLPRNFVIMRDHSPYGVRYVIGEDRGPVEKAAAQFAASPGNRAFIAEYREALTTFIAKHHDDADPALIESYKDQLDALPPSN
ncbi:hypothetical protein ABZR86_17800 [Dyella marensis]|jgi:hypothetical protein|uniref:Transmembrane protein n=1 Tax=Dyella marensis TaxID=500610 RepID=A0A1I2J469_9GAMM|nr:MULTISPECIES: hypothetical protein [Dyella]SFF48037.1 hypothetical protein SAMN02799615_03768 [Dyella marensis]